MAFAGIQDTFAGSGGLLWPRRSKPRNHSFFQTRPASHTRVSAYSCKMGFDRDHVSGTPLSLDDL